MFNFLGDNRLHSTQRFHIAFATQFIHLLKKMPCNNRFNSRGTSHYSRLAW